MVGPHVKVKIMKPIFGLFTTTLFAAFATAAFAQEYPVRPVKLVVPFGAGTTTDIVSRVFAEALTKQLGQSFVVENRAGAGGNIGSDIVAKATPDGYTILMGTVGTHAINPALYKKMPYDAQKDFVPIAFAGYTPTFLVVAANSPIKSLKELATQASKANSVSFASAGNGTSGHLAGELLQGRLGVNLLHVPYKDGGQAMTDVMSGQVNFMFYHPAAVLPHIKSGKLRALGVSSAKRSPTAPEVAPIAELGYGEFDLVPWFMLYASSATPPAILTRLRASAQLVLASEEVRGKLTALGLEMKDLKPDEISAFARSETQKWAELVKRSGAQVD
jgi:tripartite-type tricarboxylate transporter receptor subunit TctC